MKIVTSTCEECGTVVAGNVLERYRRMKCPRRTCENVLLFDDLPREDREHLRDNPEKYSME